MKSMRMLILFAVASGAVAQEDVEDRLAFLQGKYQIVGRYADSENTYSGTMHIAAEGKTCKITRTIDGKTVTGQGDIQSALGGDAQVFHIAFTEGGKKFEATYLMHVDLDNYSRLTGYVYTKATQKPGMEAAFALVE